MKKLNQMSHKSCVKETHLPQLNRTGNRLSMTEALKLMHWKDGKCHWEKENPKQKKILINAKVIQSIGHGIAMTFYEDCPTQQYLNGMNYEIQIIII